MKNYVRALLLALPFLAVPAQAQAGTFCFGFKIKISCSCSCDDCCNPCGCPAPWYTYYPYNAHFAVPAHPEFPYWPAPMASSLQMPPQAPPYMPGAVSPVGYYYQPPSYWYGR